MLKAGEERVARQSAGADALVLLREPGLQRGDHAGLARSRRPLHQRDVRCVQGDVEGDPLPIIGSRKHVAHRLRDRLQAAAVPFRDRLSLDDQAKLGNWIGTASDSLPGIGAPPDAHLVSAEAHEEIAAAWRVPVLLIRGRAKVEARRRRLPPCKLTGERPPRRPRRSCGVLTLNGRGNLLAHLERLAAESVQPLRQVAVFSCLDIDAKAPDSVGKLPAIGVGHPSKPACPPQDCLALLVVVPLPKPKVAVRLRNEGVELGSCGAPELACNARVAEANLPGREVDGTALVAFDRAPRADDPGRPKAVVRAALDVRRKPGAVKPEGGLPSSLPPGRAGEKRPCPRRLIGLAGREQHAVREPLYGALDRQMALLPLAQVVDDPVVDADVHGLVVPDEGRRELVNPDEDTVRLTVGGRGLHQPGQPGQAAEADLPERIPVPRTGAFYFPDLRTGPEQEFAALPVRQEHLRLRDQFIGKALTVRTAQIYGHYTTVNHVRYVHRATPCRRSKRMTR